MQALPWCYKLPSAGQRDHPGKWGGGGIMHTFIIISCQHKQLLNLHFMVWKCSTFNAKKKLCYSYKFTFFQLDNCTTLVYNIIHIFHVSQKISVHLVLWNIFSKSHQHEPLHILKTVIGTRSLKTGGGTHHFFDVDLLQALPRLKNVQLVCWWDWQSSIIDNSA